MQLTRSRLSEGLERRVGADPAFAALLRTAGSAILVLMLAITAFLVAQALPALRASPELLGSQVGWLPSGANLWQAILPLAFGTVLAAAIALIIAVPIAVGLALFLTYYAPAKLAHIFAYVVDLLAAVPSVVYGLWGALWLLPHLAPTWQALADYLGFIPIFHGPAANPPRTILAVGIVLAVMILPIITAVSREIFRQTPQLQYEAALALGATRWESLRLAVLPLGRAGVVGAAMLGLGRALGETMAVLMILSPGLTYSFEVLQAGRHQTVAANIAAHFPETTQLGVSALIASGLALFVITMLVNAAARLVVASNLARTKVRK